MGKRTEGLGKAVNANRVSAAVPTASNTTLGSTGLSKLTLGSSMLGITGAAGTTTTNLGLGAASMFGGAVASPSTSAAASLAVGRDPLQGAVAYRSPSGSSPISVK